MLPDPLPFWSLVAALLLLTIGLVVAKHSRASVGRARAAARTVADHRAEVGGAARLLGLQRTAGNQAVSRLVSLADSVTVQRKLGPWLGEHAKTAIDAWAASPPDYATVLTGLNGFSLDDIVAVFRDAGAGKRSALGKFITAGQQAGSLPAVDVPRFVLALRLAGQPTAAGQRAENLHHLIRGGDSTLPEAFRLLNGLSVSDQEQTLNMLTPSHWDSLVAGLGSAAGVDVPWLGTLLSGVRGAPVSTVVTVLGWLNGQEAAAGAAWAADQPDDRLAFMLRARTLKAAGQVHSERLRAMLTAGQVRRAGGEVSPVDAANVEAAFAGAQLPADQRNAIRGFLGIPAPTLPDATAEPLANNTLSSTKAYSSPSSATEESTRNLFGCSYTDLLQSMQTVHAFGQTATVAPALAQAMMRADALARQKITVAEGRPMEASDWGIGNMQGLQPPPHGLHQFGLAVDLDYKTMPYVMHESNEKPLDRKLAPIYHRISLLMLGRPSTIPNGPWSYDAYAAESDAMHRYFALSSDPVARQKQLDDSKLTDAQMTQVFDGNLPPAAERAAVLQKLIDADHGQLTAAPEPNLEAPRKPGDPPKMMDSPFDPKKGHPDPSQGFLTIREEIVVALKEADPAMRWGGTDFGNETGDLMHFDLGTGISYDQKTHIYSRKK